MNKIYLLLAALCFAGLTHAQSVGIGTTSPDASAQLDIQGNNKGLLVPRVAGTTNITNPAKGLLVYDSTANQFKVNIGTAAMPNWQPISTGASSGWGLAGNTGTDTATNFIGTTDDKDLVVKRYNVQAGFIDTINTAFGLKSLNPASTGVYNTAFGSGTLFANTLGLGNTAIGISALNSNDSGNINTAIGGAALYNNISGVGNNAIGYLALRHNVMGNINIAIGAYAGFSALGSGNVFIGNAAGSTDTGSNKLYISNSDADSANALIYGKFDTQILSLGGVGGKVGIDTTTPGVALEVNGTVKANNLTLVGGAQSDELRKGANNTVVSSKGKSGLGIRYIIAINGEFTGTAGTPNEPVTNNTMMGEIRLYAGDYAPPGYMFCEGQILNTNDYQALYFILGPNYGGNGTSTFALPDLRGAVPVGVGQSAADAPSWDLGDRVK